MQFEIEILTNQLFVLACFGEFYYVTYSCDVCNNAVFLERMKRTAWRGSTQERCNSECSTEVSLTKLPRPTAWGPSARKVQVPERTTSTTLWALWRSLLALENWPTSKESAPATVAMEGALVGLSQCRPWLMPTLFQLSQSKLCPCSCVILDANIFHRKLSWVLSLFLRKKKLCW